MLGTVAFAIALSLCGSLSQTGVVSKIMMRRGENQPAKADECPAKADECPARADTPSQDSEEASQSHSEEESQSREEDSDLETPHEESREEEEEESENQSPQDEDSESPRDEDSEEPPQVSSDPYASTLFPGRVGTTVGGTTGGTTVGGGGRDVNDPPPAKEFDIGAELRAVLSTDPTRFLYDVRDDRNHIQTPAHRGGMSGGSNVA
jgi:hypothetical protein